jgi:DoxX
MSGAQPRTKPSLVSITAQYGLSINDLLVRTLSGFAWPKVELLIRFWLAKSFFMSGVMKLTHWPTTIQLAAHDPVGFMSPLSAAYIGVSIETIGAAPLAIGLMARTPHWLSSP